MRTLHLVSPHMRGPDVVSMQKLLTTAGWHGGPEDGEYGPLTAQAVYRAKYRLGYARPDQIAGDLLRAYLTGAKKATPAMAKVAAARAAEAKKKHAVVVKKGALTHGQLIVQLALAQLGQTEHPAGSNKSLYSLWYGIIGAWCAMFVTWVFCTLGFSAKTFRRAVRYAYVPYIVADARAGANGLMLAPGPADGIINCYDWNRDGVADHTGISAEEATLARLAPAALAAAKALFGPLGAGEFWAIEGNTSVGNDSNGGTVELRKRSRTMVEVFARAAA